jgi:PAS domain S-box-containing protein
MKWINDLAKQGVVMTDDSLTIRGWNHWLEQHSGRMASEMIGRNLLAAYPDLIQRQLDQYYRDALGGQGRVLSQRLHGHLLPMPPTMDDPAFTHMRQSARIAPLVQDGRIIGTITVIDDVTERVARETELQEQIVALEALHNIGRAILSLDLEECLQRVVDQTSALMNGEMAAVVLCEGDELKLASRSRCELPLSKLSASPVNIAARVVQSGVSLNIKDISDTQKIMPLDPRHRSAAAAPLIANETIIGALVIESPLPAAFSPAELAHLDRLATQAAIAIENARLYSSLRQNEQWLSTMLQSIGDAVIATDATGRVTFTNPIAQALTGWPPDAVAGKRLEEFFKVINEKTRQPVENAVAKVLRTGAPAGPVNHTILIARDGTERPIDESGAPIRDRLNNITGAILIFRDITEHKQNEQTHKELLKLEQEARVQAEQANRLKDEFLATVSHELRAPLNAILGWVHMLRGNRMDAASVQRALETVERNARSQNQIIEDLLEVSRIISGNLRLDIRRISLIPVIEAALDALRSLALSKNIQLTARLNPQAGTVMGDSGRMQQVIWNLLSNAIKFTPPGGLVEVCLEKVDGEARITVSDNGQGIEPDFLPYVFERFRQADGSSQRIHGGLGLGLTIVYHLLELQGGTVRVHSDGKGQGATFTIALPLSAYQSGEPDLNHYRCSASQEEKPSINLTGLRVLVVDDEPDIRLMLQEALSEHGAEVVAASSCREALERLRGWPAAPLPSAHLCDVLVADIGMPDEDGYLLIRKVRTLPPQKGGRIPAIALTAYARSEDRVRAIAAGYQHYVPKPLDPEELITVVASLTGRLAGNDKIETQCRAMPSMGIQGHLVEKPDLRPSPPSAHR